MAVYLQTTTGIFDAAVQYAAGPDPWGLSAGDIDIDIDGDGVPLQRAAAPGTFEAVRALR